MKEHEEKIAVENSNLKKEEIVPAEDILTNELAEEVSGGGGSACFKGCTGGDSKNELQKMD